MNAKKGIWLFLGVLICAPVRAEWVEVSRGLAETDIRAVAVDPADPKKIYAASERRVYQTQDSGAHWKQGLGIRGADNSIHFILVDPRDGRNILVASERGIQVSRNAGKDWRYEYRGLGDNAKAVYCLSADLIDPGVLWAGTADGLVRIKGGDAQRVAGLPSIKVFSLFLTQEGSLQKVWAATEKGIYKSEDSGVHWNRVLVEAGKSGEAGEGTSLSQFQIEELSSAPALSNLALMPGTDTLLAASSRGVWQGTGKGGDWSPFGGGLPDRKVNYLAGSAETFYAATDRGVYRWDNEAKAFKDASDGLVSKEVRMLAYDGRSGDLFAATRQGVFRYPKPDFKPTSRPDIIGVETPERIPGSRQILQKFENEPTIGEVQDAAIRYAEVHPDKIKAWREAAARKAWMPTVSFTTDSSTDLNVDIDRGGTNDPDRFIIGPREEQTDWHVGVSWDLGELIWNNDQTSIDTRSKLMVELRDDVLNEVTHLYYERRRIQVEMLLTPAKELPLEVERQLKLDELTAGVDALTGGYLSRKIGASRV